MLDSGCPTVPGLEARQWLNSVQVKQRGLVANHDELDDLKHTISSRYAHYTIYAHIFKHLQSCIHVHMCTFTCMHIRKVTINNDSFERAPLTAGLEIGPGVNKLDLSYKRTFWAETIRASSYMYVSIVSSL